MTRTVEEINRKIANGDAVVLTAREVCDLVSQGDSTVVKEVDVVTTGTRGIMSGTYAVLSFPIAPPGSFDRAARVLINGIPTVIGPCPNERLGVLDLMVFGTTSSI